MSAYNFKCTCGRDEAIAELSSKLDWKAALEQASLVHFELQKVTGITCLPSQMPRFLSDKLSTARYNALTEAAETLVDGLPVGQNRSRLLTLRDKEKGGEG